MKYVIALLLALLPTALFVLMMGPRTAVAVLPLGILMASLWLVSRDPVRPTAPRPAVRYAISALIVVSVTVLAVLLLGPRMAVPGLVYGALTALLYLKAQGVERRPRRPVA